eukprot:TRINITY_DN24619_c0_g1_i1.p1 TRINITY_DN24619_c0_g1~~TRINITY_DN24619_c0_g1_i1.p1  ORF type:complete len:382 (+),score=63.36 TRINITY_DN24619_c0_g1_i1:72-1217(+)
MSGKAITDRAYQLYRDSQRTAGIMYHGRGAPTRLRADFESLEPGLRKQYMNQARREVEQTPTIQEFFEAKNTQDMASQLLDEALRAEADTCPADSQELAEWANIEGDRANAASTTLDIFEQASRESALEPTSVAISDSGTYSDSEDAHGPKTMDKASQTEPEADANMLLQNLAAVNLIAEQQRKTIVELQEVVHSVQAQNYNHWATMMGMATHLPGALSSNAGWTSQGHDVAHQGLPPPGTTTTDIAHMQAANSNTQAAGAHKSTKRFIRNNQQGELPTLKDLFNFMKKYPENNTFLKKRHQWKVVQNGVQATSACGSAYINIYTKGETGETFTVDDTLMNNHFCANVVVVNGRQPDAAAPCLREWTDLVESTPTKKRKHR